MAPDSFACEFSLKLKQLHDLNLSEKILSQQIGEKMGVKSYTIVSQNTEYLLKVTLSKGVDVHAVDKFFARVGLALYKNNNMQNYTYGIGKYYSDNKLAYGIDMYKMALENAISQLPICLSSY